MVFRKVLSLAIISLAISSCSSVAFSSSSSKELEEGYVATFSNGQKMTFFEATCDVETYYKNNYKTFDKLDSKIVDFTISNIGVKTKINTYLLLDSTINNAFNNLQKNNYSAITFANNITHVEFKLDYNSLGNRNMFLYSLTDNGKTYFLPFYNGSDYLNHNLIKDIILKPDEIKSIEVARLVFDYDSNGKEEYTKETLIRDDDEIKDSYSQLFDDYDLLEGNVEIMGDSSGPIPETKIILTKSNGEMVRINQLSNWIWFSDVNIYTDTFELFYLCAQRSFSHFAHSFFE